MLMIDEEGDYFGSLLKEHKKRKTLAEPAFPKQGIIFGPLRLIMRNPPSRLPRKTTHDDRQALLDIISQLRAENAQLKSKLAGL